MTRSGGRTAAERRAAAVERGATAYVVDENGCWISTYRPTVAGYGQVGYQDPETGKPRMLYAHRASWEFYRGPIPAGYEVDHICERQPCLNPDHLQLVSPSENKRLWGVRNSARRRAFKESVGFDEAQEREIAARLNICGAPCPTGNLTAWRKYRGDDLGWTGHCNQRVKNAGEKCYRHHD